MILCQDSWIRPDTSPAGVTGRTTVAGAQRDAQSSLLPRGLPKLSGGALVAQCARSLTCEFAYFEAMTYTQRVSWVQDFMNDWGYFYKFYGQFNNVKAVIQATGEHVWITPGKLLLHRRRTYDRSNGRGTWSPA